MKETFLKTFFNDLKNKLTFVFFFDLLFTFFLFAFILYARNKIYSYLSEIQNYSPQILEIKSSLENNSANYAQLENLIDNFDVLTTKSLFFTYLIIPLVMFLIFVVFQGLSYKYLNIKNLKEILDFNYLLKFSILTLPLFFIGYFALKKFLDLINSTFLFYSGVDVVNLYQQIFLFFLSLFIISYIFVIAYLFLNRNSLIDAFKKTFITGFKKSYSLIPTFLPLFILLVLYFILLTRIYLNYTLNYLERFDIVAIIGLILVIFSISIYKIFFSLMLKRIET